MPKKQQSIDGLDGLEQMPEFAQAAANYHRARKRKNAAKKARDACIQDVINARINHELEPDGLGEVVDKLAILQAEMEGQEAAYKQAADKLKGILEAHEAR